MNLQLYIFVVNMNMYTGTGLSIVQDLDEIGNKIDDASVAAILLGGLTEKYEPMIPAPRIPNSNFDVNMFPVSKISLVSTLCNKLGLGDRYFMVWITMRLLLQ